MPKADFLLIFKLLPQVWDCSHVFWLKVIQIYLSVNADLMTFARGIKMNRSLLVNRVGQVFGLSQIVAIHRRNPYQSLCFSEDFIHIKSFITKTRLVFSCVSSLVKMFYLSAADSFLSKRPRIEFCAGATLLS